MLALLALPPLGAAQTYRDVCDFGTAVNIGSEPQGGVVADSGGNIYGTSSRGGAWGVGIIWEITSRGVFKDLHDFGSYNGDGYYPTAGVAIDGLGNLYGTASRGGDGRGDGMVWELTAGGTYTDLHEFGLVPNDGTDPRSGASIDSDGNLYGTTAHGGANGAGTVWEITSAGNYERLHDFGGTNTHGAYPQAGVTVDSKGNLFGTAGFDGDGSVFGYGMVWEIMSSREFKDLYDFGSDGATNSNLNGGVAQDSLGNLYGTELAGGTYSEGLVWEITSSGNFKDLHDFGGTASDGQGPLGGVTVDGQGNLYGTTQAGGHGVGVVWQIPSTGGYHVLHYFASPTRFDGGQPECGVCLDAAGNLFGTTFSGGSMSSGTVWEIAPFVTVGPQTVIGSSGSVGTINLSSPAPSGGTVVKLVSSLPEYVGVPSSVIVPAGKFSVSFTVTTKAHKEIYTARIKATDGETTASAPIMVNNGLLTGISVSPGSVLGGGDVVGTVTLSSPAPICGWPVRLTTSKPDYVKVPASVTVLAGQTSVTFPVSTVSESFTYGAELKATDGAPRTYSAALSVSAEPKISTLTFSPSSVLGGSSSTATLTLDGPAPGTGFLLNLTCSDPGFVRVPFSVTVPGGQVSTTFSVATQAYPSDYKVSIRVSDSVQKISSSLTVLANPLVGSLSFTPSSVSGGSGSTGTFKLRTTAGRHVVVSLSSSDPGFVGVPASVTVPTGQTSATFAVTTVAYTETYTVTIKASFGTGSTTAPLKVLANAAIASVSFSPNSVAGGTSSTGTVTLESAAGNGGCIVNLSSTNSLVGVPASVTVPSGKKTAMFSVSTQATATAYTAGIKASDGSGAVSAVFSVVTNPAIQSFSLSPTTVAGGSDSTGTITLSAAAPAGGSVVSLACGNAYIGIPATVTVPAGRTWIKFQVKTQPYSASYSAEIKAANGTSKASEVLTVIE